MTRRRRLSLDVFFAKIVERLRYVAPAPRARIRETWGLIVWRKRGLKTGVVVSPELGGAFVFLGMGMVQIDSVEEAAAILEAIFSGEVVEVSAEGLGVWLARSDFLAARINRMDKGRGVDVPVIGEFVVRAWTND